MQMMGLPGPIIRFPGLNLLTLTTSRKTYDQAEYQRTSSGSFYNLSESFILSLRGTAPKGVIFES